jgi:hypothetical protein
MIVPEIPPPKEALRGVHTHSSYKRVKIVVATLLAATAFVPAGVPTATVGPASRDTSILYSSLPCGDEPGVCPDTSFMQQI